jgi:hypothetical protein
LAFDNYFHQLATVTTFSEMMFDSGLLCQGQFTIYVCRYLFRPKTLPTQIFTIPHIIASHLISQSMGTLVDTTFVSILAYMEAQIIARKP